MYNVKHYPYDEYDYRNLNLRDAEHHNTEYLHDIYQPPQTDRPYSSGTANGVRKQRTTLMQASLALLDDFANKFHREGNEIDCLRFMERALELRKDLRGITREEVQQCAEIFVKKCNILAMKFLKEENFVMSLQFLKKAEFYTDNDEYIHDEELRYQLRAGTFNNMACFFQKRGKYQEALRYCQFALDIEESLPNVDNPGATNLNMCAILSKLKKHKLAYEHAKKALDELIAREKREDRDEYVATGKLDLQVIAYHNMAVEKEFLKKYGTACDLYSKALSIAERDLGMHHPTTLAIQHDYEKCFKKLQKKREEQRRNEQRKEIWMRLTNATITPRIIKGDIIFPKPSKSKKDLLPPKIQEKRKKSPKKITSRTKLLEPGLLPPLRNSPYLPKDEDLKGILFGANVLV